MWQMLKPREKVDMPVFFFIDPSCLSDRSMDAIDTITLSYTFFRSASCLECERVRSQPCCLMRPYVCLRACMRACVRACVHVPRRVGDADAPAVAGMLVPARPAVSVVAAASHT